MLINYKRLLHFYRDGAVDPLYSRGFLWNWPPPPDQARICESKCCFSRTSTTYQFQRAEAEKGRCPIMCRWQEPRTSRKTQCLNLSLQCSKIELGVRPACLYSYFRILEPCYVKYHSMHRNRNPFSTVWKRGLDFLGGWLRDQFLIPFLGTRSTRTFQVSKAQRPNITRGVYHSFRKVYCKAVECVNSLEQHFGTYSLDPSFYTL